MRRPGRPPKPLAEKLRQAITSSRRTYFDIALAVGVHPSAITRFMAGKDLRLATVDRLLELFDFEVVKRKRKG